MEDQLAALESRLEAWTTAFAQKIEELMRMMQTLKDNLPVARPDERCSRPKLGNHLSIMLENSVDLEDQGQQNRIGTDLFGFYKCEIVDLLTPDENISPLSSRTKDSVKVSSDIPDDGKGTDSFSHVSSLFNNSVESSIPDVKRELLKSSLRQSARALTQEVDEMFDPVIRISHVISCLNSKRTENSGGKASNAGDSTILPCKKLKTSSSSAKGERLDDKSRDAEQGTDVIVDLELLLESEPFLVEETMIKQSDELLVTLNHMEKQLEDLLYAVVSKCRRSIFHLLQVQNLLVDLRGL